MTPQGNIKDSNKQEIHHDIKAIARGFERYIMSNGEEISRKKTYKTEIVDNSWLNAQIRLQIVNLCKRGGHKGGTTSGTSCYLCSKSTPLNNLRLCLSLKTEF